MRVLVDAGALIALLNRNDTYHGRISEFFANLSVSVLRLVERGRLQVVEITAGVSRMADLMQRYADHPMDVADASLVWAAEQTGVLRIVTLDRSDFQTYRIKGRQRILIVLATRLDNGAHDPQHRNANERDGYGSMRAHDGSDYRSDNCRARDGCAEILAAPRFACSGCQSFALITYPMLLLFLRHLQDAGRAAGDYLIEFFKHRGRRQRTRPLLHLSNKRGALLLLSLCRLSGLDFGLRLGLRPRLRQVIWLRWLARHRSASWSL